MTGTNNFPGIGYTTFGPDWNYYQQVSVSATTFGGGSVDGHQPDLIVTLPSPTACVIFTNLSSSGTVEYSFNGTVKHGQITGYATTGLNQQLYFYNRVISKIWFRIATGSATVSVEAWSL